MADRNKVKFGLKSLYYALLTNIASDGTATFGTPKAFPGAKSLSLSPEGDMEEFYFDDIVYWTCDGNAGYKGNLEVAKVTDDFKIDVLGYVRDSNGVLVENANAEVQPFALLFQMAGDAHARRHVLYNNTAGRPEFNASTIEGKKSPITDVIPLTSKAIHNSALNIDTPKASVGQDDTTAYNAWFTEVYQSTAVATGTVAGQSSGVG